MFKFYNPFKPHIVLANDGKYYIRKYVIGYGWEYKERKSNILWCLEEYNVKKYCAFNEYEDVVEDLDNFKKFLAEKKKSFKVIKVLNDA